ncbi:MAG: tRNA glutamyl-Q(34) synthetase GluQRS [Candidatus Obscuribacterales bacterium]|nr:tRNA glutamyl-Q(34) synthetase GluQRS [Candidatus Obscuribacterales bacterium]
MEDPVYRGRIAPSPTGYLHVGHARTFWQASERAKAAGGQLILRNEDIDGPRCKPEFLAAIIEDLSWFGFEWHEGPDIGGPFGPYTQSQRRHLYMAALERLKAAGFVYPCFCSRKDIAMAASAPHGTDDEVIYPGTCRPPACPTTTAAITGSGAEEHGAKTSASNQHFEKPVTWRFRVPDGESVSFIDGNFGAQCFTGGTHFGDFVVWRPDDHPAYQLAVVVDDAAMRITEVVRGADLLVSTARQILLFRALELPIPAFFHCELVTDETGARLAKRHASLSLRALRESGQSPQAVRTRWARPESISRI